MSQLSAYWGISRQSVRAANKSEYCQQLLDLDDPHRPAQQQLLVSVVEALLQVRYALRYQFAEEREQALGKLASIVAQHAAQLPSLRELEILIKNKSYWFKQTICYHLRQLIENLSPPLQIQLGNKFATFLVKNRVRLQHLYKGSYLRSDCERQKILAVKSEALAYFKTKVYARIYALNDHQQQQDVINNIILFNQSCDLILRTRVNFGMSWHELRELAAPIFIALNFNLDEQSEFIHYCLFINLQRNCGFYALDLLKKLCAFSGGLATLIINVYTLGLIEMLMLSFENVVAPSSVHFAMVGLGAAMVAASIAGVVATASILPVLGVVPLFVSATIRGTTAFADELEFNAAALTSPTRTFSQLVQDFKHEFSELNLSYCARQIVDLYRRGKQGDKAGFMQAVNFEMNSRRIIQNLLYNNPYAISEDADYFAMMEHPGVREQIRANAVKWGQISIEFRQQYQLNNECPIGLDEFNLDTDILLLKMVNGVVRAFKADNLLKWLFQALPLQRFTNPLDNLRPWLMPQQAILAPMNS